MRLRLLPLLLLFWPAFPVPAADGPLRLRTAAPMLGFAYDPGAAAIRPIRGVPGAALLGDPIDTGFPAALAAIAPMQAVALAVSGEDGMVRVVHLQANANAIEAKLNAAVVAGAMASPDLIVFSPSGSAALLYSAAAARLQVLTGLPNQPAVRDLPLTGTPGALALADDGAAALLPGDGGAQIWFADGSAAPSPLPFSPAAAAFRRGMHDALAVTASGDLYLFQASANQWTQIHAGDAATRSPAGVQFSADGTLAYVAAAAGDISAFNLSTGESNTVTCNCAPTSLDALMEGSVYSLTSASSSLLWVLDASQTTPRLWFVPRRNSQ